MAGGRGTRLRPLTEDVPKPMLRVAGRPILERIVLHLVGFGIEQHLRSRSTTSADVIEDHFGDGERVRLPTIDYLREERAARHGRRAGAAAERRRPRPLLVMNGDLVT